MKDDVAYNAVVRGYNDWLAEEYCPTALDRLIGLGVLPYSSLDATMDELENCAKLGFKGVILNGFPNGHGYPLPEDAHFWAAVLAMDMPVAVHVDLDRTGERAGPFFKYPVNDEDAFRYTDLVAQVARFGRAAGANAIQLIVSGLFDRFPNLRI
ncbi:MAG: amidohydrolase family protein, partial [Chloroflexi bacterium]|nr:amidohydrolase family protein [Chloroflexota bacterium]